MKTGLRAVAVASGAIFALALGGAAWAITSNVFKYSTDQNGWLMISPSAFVPEDGLATQWTKGTGQALQGTDPSTLVCFSAPVALPHSAKLTGVRLWYARSQTGELTYSFQSRDSVYDFGVGTSIIPTRHAPSSTGTTSLNRSITDPSVQTIDNRRYTYFFRVCMNGGGEVWAVRVAYTYNNAGA